MRMIRPSTAANLLDGIVIADLPIAVSHRALRVVRLTATEFTGK